MPSKQTSRKVAQARSISHQTSTNEKAQKKQLAELEKKLARIQASDDLTASQFSLISHAVEATTLSQMDKDQVLRNVVQLCNPQAQASIGAI